MTFPYPDTAGQQRWSLLMVAILGPLVVLGWSSWMLGVIGWVSFLPFAWMFLWSAWITFDQLIAPSIWKEEEQLSVPQQLDREYLKQAQEARSTRERELQKRLDKLEKKVK